MGSLGRAQPVEPSPCLQGARPSPRLAPARRSAAVPRPVEPSAARTSQEIALDKELLSLQEAKKKRVAPRPATYYQATPHRLTLPRPCVCPGGCSYCTSECVCTHLHTRMLLAPTCAPPLPSRLTCRGAALAVRSLSTQSQTRKLPGS